MVLTEKQKKDLHKSIAEYLISLGYENSLSAFCEEADCEKPTEVKGTTMMEKKWTSVVRLQRKVLDLESKVQTLETELASMPKRKTRKEGDEVPVAPARFSLTGHRSPVTAVIFHPVFSLLISASEDSTIKIWDYETGAFERTLKGHTNIVNDVAIENSGRLLASCSADLSVKLWDLEAFECTQTLMGHDHNVSSVAFFPSGDYLVSSSRDKTLRVWDVGTGYCVRTVSGHSEWVRRCLVSPDGSLLASCSNDHSIRLWNAKDYQCTADLRTHDHVVECLAFSPASANAILTSSAAVSAGFKGTAVEAKDGQFLASGGRDKLIKITHVPSQQTVLALAGHDNWVRAVVWHPCGKYLLSVSDDRSIRIWDLTQGRATKTLRDAHEHFVTALAFHPTAPLALTGSVDQTIKIWECK
eukprot:GCRY01002608.1.p1 GENE.GCRY01002608.1~~GCRY01002608.1.p1  ORF type:complete len:414 (+),score=63.65 GCRY01002608.1:149-1390(+)